MKIPRILLLLSVCMFAVTGYADEVSFRSQAPSQVVVGKAFQLTFTVNKRARDLQAPSFDHFDFLAGPFTSQSSSTSFVNGKHTSTFTQTFTYTLMPTEEGEFTIEPATVRVDGQEYRSNSVKIKVLPPDEPAATSGQGTAANTNTTRNANTSDNVSSENIFIRTIVSKSRVYEQEVLLLTYKLYFAGVDVAQFTNNTRIPEFTGFLKQDLEQGEIQTELEHYNGRNYQTAVLYRTLLYPQHSGDIKIEPASFEAVLRVQMRQPVRSIFDDFFGSYTNVTKTLVAPGLTVHADPLPAGKPAGYSGGVGQFTFNGQISSTELSTNEAVTIRLTIQGTGNMKLLKTPAVDWPEGFETYDAKVNNNFKTTTAGLSGTKTIEYLAIPRAAGSYTIPAVQFAYFDTSTGQYKSQTAGPWTLTIHRAAGSSENTGTEVQNYVNKENIKQLGTDIRYIHTRDLTYQPQASKPMYRTRTILFAYLLPLILAVILFILFRRQIRENADLSRVRYKRANKVAQKRLKEARKRLEEKNNAAFYEAIERAAWTYLSDRLTIPTAELNKENIASILRDKNIEESQITEVTEVLTTAEFARYAPTGENAMHELYERTANLINNLENQKL